MPKNRQVIIGSAEFIVEAMAYISVCYYFYGVSKYWQYVQIPTIVLPLVGVATLFFMPESPRFLVCQKKYD